MIRGGSRRGGIEPELKTFFQRKDQFTLGRLEIGSTAMGTAQHQPGRHPESQHQHAIAFRAGSADPWVGLATHKAQGSGFGHVVCVLPPEPSPVTTRELLYTAVTRARDRVTLFASENVIRHSVLTRVQRASGLPDALRAAV